MKAKLTFICLVVFVQACTSTSNDVFLEAKPISPVEEKINALAEVVVQRTTRIQHLQESQYIELNGEYPSKPDMALLPTLTQFKSLGKNYIGKLDPFIRRLSVVAGMNTPRFIGPKPTNDILLNIDTDYRTVNSMLEQAGSLTGSRADIVYKASENLLEVKYPSK